MIGCTADIKTVERTTDQGKLAEIALSADNDDKVRLAAVEKLTDQVALAKLAVDEKNESTRHAAVRKLSDQTLLAKCATEDTNEEIRRTAVEKTQRVAHDTRAPSSRPGCSLRVLRIFPKEWL